MGWRLEEMEVESRLSFFLLLKDDCPENHEQQQQDIVDTSFLVDLSTCCFSSRCSLLMSSPIGLCPPALPHPHPPWHHGLPNVTTSQEPATGCSVLRVKWDSSMPCCNCRNRGCPCTRKRSVEPRILSHAMISMPRVSVVCWT